MKTIRSASSLPLLVLLCTAAAHAATPPTVPVGNPGNAADTRYGTPGVGAVGYTFLIGKTEVTNAQYAAFLSAVAATDSYGLYNPSMTSDTWGGIVRNGPPGSYTYQLKPPALAGAYAYDNKPVVEVNSGDAMRFANWLHNGMPTGPQDASTTEDGAYALNGATSAFDLVAVTRKPGARWWLPNLDEWYKAAYHKNDGVTGNYWDYPTRADSVPNNNSPSADTGNSANYWDLLNNVYATGNESYPLTDAGAYTNSEGPYLTFDQGGNANEWTEMVSLVFGFQRIVKGGAWDNISDGLHAASGGFPDASLENRSIGFRVATIPEPAGATLCIATITTLMLHPRGRGAKPWHARRAC